MLAFNFYPLDCEELLSYTKQDYYWPESSYLNYFEEVPNIPPLKEELHVEENIVLEDYVEVKEQNIENSEEMNEDLVMEEDPKIKISVEESNEDPIIEKDLEVVIVETIEEEIEDESFKNLNEIKSYDCESQDPFILVVNNTPKLIEFIGVDRFDSTVNSYLVNLYNYMRSKEKEIQVDLFIPLMSYKYGKKIKGLNHSKYLFIWSGRFQISKINSSTSTFQEEQFDAGHNLLINFCNYLILVF